MPGSVHDWVGVSGAEEDAAFIRAFTFDNLLGARADKVKLYSNAPRIPPGRPSCLVFMCLSLLVS